MPNKTRPKASILRKVSFTPPEYDRVVLAAHRKGLTVASYIRTRLGLKPLHARRTAKRRK